MLSLVCSRPRGPHFFRRGGGLALGQLSLLTAVARGLGSGDGRRPLAAARRALTSRARQMRRAFNANESNENNALVEYQNALKHPMHN